MLCRARATLADIEKEDYYSEEDGWDVKGLRSDLAIYMRIRRSVVTIQ